jgi:WD40 repeat protein
MRTSLLVVTSLSLFLAASLGPGGELLERRKIKGHAEMVWSLGFAPNGQTLASGSHDQTIKLCDVKTGRERATLEGHRVPKNRLALGGHTDVVASVALMADGKTLATGSWDRTIKLWDLAPGKEHGCLKGHTNRVWSVAFSPDGKLLASGGRDSTVRLWDVAAGKQKAILKGHATGVSSVAFTPDGRTLASGSNEGTEGRTTVKLWDVATARERATLKGAAPPLAICPSGDSLASGSE